MDIAWPDRYSPENTSVHISNELEVAAAPAVIWSWLVRASLWPEWYPTVSKVTIDGGGNDLAARSRFTCRIFGVTLSAKVEEFVPYEHLAWSAQFEGVDAYHAWLIEQRATVCRVLTEENQRGWLARLNNLVRPSNMTYYHHLWLEALSFKAKEGPAPQPRDFK